VPTSLAPSSNENFSRPPVTKSLEPRLNDILIAAHRAAHHKKAFIMNNATRFALALSILTTAAAPLAASAAPAALTSGPFVSAAHATSGTATIYKLDDGSRILRLSNLRMSNGPKVHVILADHAVTGNDVEDAKSLDLGDLKGNTGNQNYVIPAGVNLDAVKSVAIYCERFKVNFGSASLK
jgi:hypothetical protein